MNKKWIIALICIAVLGGLYATNGFQIVKTAQSEEKVSESSKDTIPVVLTKPVEREFTEKLTVQGNLEARDFVLVPSRIKGTIETMFVDEGDKVIKEKTKLFQIDSVNLENAVKVCEQDLAVAKCSLQEKQASLESVEINLKKTEIDFTRFKKLYQEDVVPIDKLEQYETGYLMAEASLKHAKSLVNLSIEQVEQAEIALEMAKKNLSDSLVYAPIDGVISYKYQEIGEMGEEGKSVFRIDNPKIIEVSAYLPAQYYQRIKTGETTAHIKIYDIDVGENIIIYKSPTIDPVLRTFEVKCLLDNPPEGVVPGAMANINVILQKRTGIGIPAKAIQKRSKKNILFTIKNNKAFQIEVSLGLETDGWVEIIGDTLSTDTPVVTMGQYYLNMGTPVTIMKEDV